jgi:hypothetical protein
MSCSITPKLLSFYTNKVNIYDSDCFIALPNYKTCPPPPCVYIAPQMVFPPAGPYVPPAVCPIPQPVNPSGSYCGQLIAPYNPVCGNPSINCGTEIPCGPCGTAPETVGIPSCAPSYTPSGPGAPQPQIVGCSSCGS